MLLHDLVNSRNSKVIRVDKNSDEETDRIRLDSILSFFGESSYIGGNSTWISR